MFDATTLLKRAFELVIVSIVEIFDVDKLLIVTFEPIILQNEAEALVILFVTVTLEVANVLFDKVVINALGTLRLVPILIFDVDKSTLDNVNIVADGDVILFPTIRFDVMLTFELVNVLFESVVIVAFGTLKLEPILIFDADKSTLDNVNIVASGVVKLLIIYTFEDVSVLFEIVVIRLLVDVNVSIIAVPGICKLA
jgi:hypothetical protein